MWPEMLICMLLSPADPPSIVWLKAEGLVLGVAGERLAPPSVPKLL